MGRTDAAPFRGPIGVVQEQAALIGGGGEEGASYPPPPSSRLPLECIEEERRRRKTRWGRPGRKMRVAGGKGGKWATQPNPRKDG
jgi:hypothetical protein